MYISIYISKLECVENTLIKNRKALLCFCRYNKKKHTKQEMKHPKRQFLKYKVLNYNYLKFFSLFSLKKAHKTIQSKSYITLSPVMINCTNVVFAMNYFIRSHIWIIIPVLIQQCLHILDLY